MLAESPPLPPPAEVSSFGGLDGFGLGDLGFDPGALGDVLDDIKNEAGGLMDVARRGIGRGPPAARRWPSLGDLANVGNPIKPLADQTASLGKVGDCAEGNRQRPEGVDGVMR